MSVVFVIFGAVLFFFIALACVTAVVSMVLWERQHAEHRGDEFGEY